METISGISFQAIVAKARAAGTGGPEARRIRGAFVKNPGHEATPRPGRSSALRADANLPSGAWKWVRRAIVLKLHDLQSAPNLGENMKRLMFAASVVLALMAATPAASLDTARALANYRAVIAGTKQLSQLTPEEREEVLLFARAMSRSAPSGGSEECRDAKQDADYKRRELVDYARRLMRCAESSDLTDNCYTEARRARNAQSDFESAVSEVDSECD